MVNEAEKKSTIGLRDLYIALVTQDDADAYAADTPQIFAPAVKASHKPVSNSKTQSADDAPYDTTITEGATTVDIEVTGIPLSIKALLLGKEFDVATGRMLDGEGIAPDVALSFRSKKSNGKYKYCQYLKGKFSPPNEDQATQEETPDPKTITITFTAIFTTHKFTVGDKIKAYKKLEGDEDTEGFSGTSWFDAVQLPAAGSPSALTCTPAPVDGATNQAVGVVTSLTFNNALAGNAEKGVVLVREDTAAPIAITRTLSADRKTLTLTHAALTAGKTYLLVVAGVVDVYGQALTDAVYDFTIQS